MGFQERYENEKAFMDRHAEQRLAILPQTLKVASCESFEDLCGQISYLRSVPPFLGEISGKRVLEIGCGDGWISLRFAKSGAEVWACDISPKMIDLAKQYAQAAQLSVKFETMVCEEMSYADDYFDIVFMHFVLHHCDIETTAKQIRRVLRTSGKAVLVEDYAYHPFLKIYRYLTPSRHTYYEHPLTNDDCSLLVPYFGSCSFDYSGLLNLFETSANRFIRPVKPLLRHVDDFLLGHWRGLARYSRIVVIKALK